jgi:hypothetical protein
MGGIVGIQFQNSVKGTGEQRIVHRFLKFIALIMGLLLESDITPTKTRQGCSPMMDQENYVL